MRLRLVVNATLGCAEDDPVDWDKQIKGRPRA
jgi:hypothetical protein